MRVTARNIVFFVADFGIFDVVKVAQGLVEHHGHVNRKGSYVWRRVVPFDDDIAHAAASQ